MCSLDELMPSVGTTLPSPLVLAATISQSDYTLQDIHKHCPGTDPFDMDFNNPFDFFDESHIISKTHLISISDDGKVWKWLLTAEGSRDGQDINNVKKVAGVREAPVAEVESQSEASSADDHAMDTATYRDDKNSREKHQSGPTIVADEVSFKVGGLVNLTL